MVFDIKKVAAPGEHHGDQIRTTSLIQGWA